MACGCGPAPHTAASAGSTSSHLGTLSSPSFPPCRLTILPSQAHVSLTTARHEGTLPLSFTGPVTIMAPPMYTASHHLPTAASASSCLPSLSPDPTERTRAIHVPLPPSETKLSTGLRQESPPSGQLWGPLISQQPELLREMTRMHKGRPCNSPQHLKGTRSTKK